MVGITRKSITGRTLHGAQVMRKMQLQQRNIKRQFLSLQRGAKSSNRLFCGSGNEVCTLSRAIVIFG